MGVAFDHLWQSTLFVAGAALLAWALRRHQARARYVVWLTASVKFLVPYAVMTAGARLLPWPTSSFAVPATAARFFDTADAVGTPFSAVSSGASGIHAATPAGLSFTTILLAAWLAGTVVLVARWIVLSRRLRHLRLPLESVSERERHVLARIGDRSAKFGVTVVLADSGLEPGVAGVFRPVLFWPTGISDRLTDEQIDAVVAHEMAHVRWYDNAAAMAHVAVEALFWFHPLVWWLGARLVDERERACDEAVLADEGRRQEYAEAILRICEFHVASPLPFIAGVTGSDLRRRIESIMQGDVGKALIRSRRYLLAIVIVASVALPVGLGAWRHEPAIQVPASSAPVENTPVAFEAASIKPNTSGSNGARLGWEPGGLYVGVNITAASVISGAYPSKVNELIGAPDWLSREHFDVTARAAGAPTPQERQRMLQAFLADRFKFSAHYQSQERAVYRLELARTDRALGPQLRAVNIQCDMFKPVGEAPQRLTFGEAPCSFRMNAGGNGKVTMISGGRTMDAFGDTLAGLLGRPVVDATGLRGYYEFSLDYPDEQISGALFTALREQLGLKLESARAPLDVLVIDHIERPAAD